MKKKTYLELLLLMVITFSFTACDINNNDEPYLNTTDGLCSKTWVETYTTKNNLYCTHKLSFAYNGAGQELFIYNNLDINGNPLNTVIKTESYNFNWDWDTSNNECLVLDYGNNTVLYFDNVWVRNDYLSGKFEGDNVLFSNSNMR
ncbi:hypothetical protein [uncultured Bacteroides sp.]|uniref:hypothetical protein n=1 Tax=uncultured Bacteroides sp. TaxID=162156 RepID=UPI002AAC2DF1|nr:hypothetical protein [uncultured Bacteroides sp.]